MKVLFRVLGVLLLVLLVAVIAGFLFRDPLLKRMAVRNVQRTSGLEIEIGELRSTVRPLSVQMLALDVKNPPGFGDEEAFRIEEFYVEVERRTLFTDEIRLPEVRLRVPRMVVIQDEQGRTNIERIGRDLGRARREAPPAEDAPPADAPPADAPERPGETAPAPARRGFRIDRLETYVGELEIREHRRGEAEPRIRRVPMNREVVFTDVTDLEAVARQLAVQWAAAALPGLLDQAAESGDVQETLRGLQDMFRQRRRARREEAAP